MYAMLHTVRSCVAFLLSQVELPNRRECCLFHMVDYLCVPIPHSDTRMADRRLTKSNKQAPKCRPCASRHTGSRRRLLCRATQCCFCVRQLKPWCSRAHASIAPLSHGVASEHARVSSVFPAWAVLGVSSARLGLKYPGCALWLRHGPKRYVLNFAHTVCSANT